MADKKPAPTKTAAVKSTDAPKPGAPATPSSSPAAAAPQKKNSNTKTVVIVVSIVVFLFVILPLIFLSVGAIFLGNKLADNGVSSDGKSISINDGNGNTFSSGGGASLPEGFPKDVTLYKGDITSSGKVNVSGTTGWTVMVTTPDSLQQVSSSIANAFSQNGWTTQLNTSADNGALLTATKGDLRVSTYSSTKDGKTTILYTVNTQSAEESANDAMMQ